MANKNNMQRLLSPASIVLIGGSNLEQPIKNTRDIGFKGELWVVNNKYSEIAGVQCYPTVDDLPGVPDAAFVAVNALASIEVTRALQKKGCGGVVCYAAGFAEIGEAGSKLQEELVQAAGDMALVGPNCYGLLNFTQGVALWPDRLAGKATEQGIAIISQSGNVALNLTMQDRSLPITHVISLGNQAALEVGDYIEPLLDDPKVKAIGFYLEGLKDIESFSRSALKAIQRGVPLVVLKAGTSELGTQLTLSHTSSLAGSDAMYQAMFDRLGIIRVHSLSELIETLKVAAVCERPQGQRIGVLTCSGGDSAMLADTLDVHGLQLPPLTSQQCSKLKQVLPTFASLSNPLDYNTSIWGNHAACTEVFSTIMQGEYDITLLALDFPHRDLGDDREWQVAVDALISAHQQCKKTTAVICNLSELMPACARTRLIEAGIAPLQGLQDGVAAIASLVRFAERRKEINLIQDPLTLILRNAESAIGTVKLIDEWSSKQLVSAYGIHVPSGRKSSLLDLAQTANSVGYPLVLKGVSDQLAHKTEIGAVVLNLKSAESVVAAGIQMAETLIAHGINDPQFLVEPMVLDSVGEIIVGLKKDEQFGLALIIGTGGILVNLLNDSVILLLPTDRAAVLKAVTQLKGIQLLQGYRGRPEGDVDALIDSVMAITDFAMVHWDSVVELDINPLMVLPKGKGVIAVDALINMLQ